MHLVTRNKKKVFILSQHTEFSINSQAAVINIWFFVTFRRTNIREEQAFGAVKEQSVLPSETSNLYSAVMGLRLGRLQGCVFK